MGTACCLDETNNKVCDEDELGNTITCEKPYIKAYSDCCLDTNDNGICDNEETEATCNKPYMKFNDWCPFASSISLNFFKICSLNSWLELLALIS